MATKINPYLNFNGNCEEAFTFYKNAFKTEFSMISRASDSPMPVSEKEKNFIMHIELPIGETKLMGADNFESFGKPLVMGNNNCICISVDAKQEADRLFAELSEGGKVEVSIGEQFFGYFGSFQDKFGIHWMIVFEE